MKEYIDFERITLLSKGDETVALYQKMIKLSEEAGEISDAVDNFDIKEIVEELCDTINVAVDIVNAVNTGSENYQIDSSVIEVPDSYELSEIELVNRINSEVGKCSQAFLRLDGSKNVSKSAGNGEANLVKQVNEVIKWCNTTITLIEKHYDSISEDFVVEMFSGKLDKWETKQNKYKTKAV